jgi:hypothetical protein
MRADFGVPPADSSLRSKVEHLAHTLHGEFGQSE